MTLKTTTVILQIDTPTPSTSLIVAGKTFSPSSTTGSSYTYEMDLPCGGIFTAPLPSNSTATLIGNNASIITANNTLTITTAWKVDFLLYNGNDPYVAGSSTPSYPSILPSQLTYYPASSPSQAQKITLKASTVLHTPPTIQGSGFFMPSTFYTLVWNFTTTSITIITATIYNQNYPYGSGALDWNNDLFMSQVRHEIHSNTPFDLGIIALGAANSYNTIP